MITALNSPTGYEAAQLDTQGKFSFEYGEIEARIWEPAGSGLCTQFWLLGDSATLGPDCWPTCGEIDAHEAIGNTPQIAYAFLHGPSPDPGSQEYSAAVNSALPLTSGFHTYGLIWRPNLLTWTIDGVRYATATPKSLTQGSSWVFNDHTFHVVLDLAVGGWPGAPTPSTVFPARMYIDWVRVYQ
jgi:beta-glucanase (GH16 family)